MAKPHDPRRDHPDPQTAARQAEIQAEKQAEILEQRIATAELRRKSAERNRVAIAFGVLPLLFGFIVAEVDLPSWVLGSLISGIFASVVCIFIYAHLEATSQGTLLQELYSFRFSQKDLELSPASNNSVVSLFLYMGVTLGAGSFMCLIVCIFIFTVG